MRVRKRSITVDAIQWTGTNVDAVLGFVLGRAAIRETGDVSSSRRSLIVETLEGEMRADTNDWIIRGVKGEYYPCKPDIFTATYDVLDE